MGLGIGPVVGQPLTGMGSGAVPKPMPGFHFFAPTPAKALPPNPTPNPVQNQNPIGTSATSQQPASQPLTQQSVLKQLFSKGDELYNSQKTAINDQLAGTYNADVSDPIKQALLQLGAAPSMSDLTQAGLNNAAPTDLNGNPLGGKDHPIPSIAQMISDPSFLSSISGNKFSTLGAIQQKLATDQINSDRVVSAAGGLNSGELGEARTNLGNAADASSYSAMQDVLGKIGTALQGYQTDFGKAYSGLTTDQNAFVNRIIQGITKGVYGNPATTPQAPPLNPTPPGPYPLASGANAAAPRQLGNVQDVDPRLLALAQRLGV